MVDVYIFWVLGGFFPGVGVGAYGPNFFLTSFMTENMMEVVSVAFLQYGGIIFSLILYLPFVGFCVGIIIIEMFS